MRKLAVFLATLVVMLIFAGCAINKASNDVNTNTEITTVQDGPGMRVITDLTGKSIEIPPADKISKVVIIAPPLASTYASVMQKNTEKLVGMHPMSIASANASVLTKLIPNLSTINTKFLNGFTSNTEELLKMEPDLILVYGESQKKGLENIGVPVVDFFMQEQTNEGWSVETDRLMREIFEVNTQQTLKSEWDKAKAAVEPVLKSQEDKATQKALMIMSNTGDKITVRGLGSYGDDWLKMSGVSNVAESLKGDAQEVTMEQIYQWNPDIVYVFNGIPAKAYLAGGIKGQDWSKISAFSEKRIYDTPKGIMNWGAPNSDSPLMLQWLVSKNFPSEVNSSSMAATIKAYYSTFHRIELTDNEVEVILNPNEDK